MAKAAKKSVRKHHVNVIGWGKGKTARAGIQVSKGRIVEFDLDKRLIPEPCRLSGSSFQYVVTTYTDKRGHIHQNFVYRPHPGCNDVAYLRRLFPGILD